MEEISIGIQEAVIAALKKLGEYDSAEYLGKWNGYLVFEPTFKELQDPMPMIGIPPYFIADDEKLEVVLYGTEKYDEINSALLKKE